ncbi:acyltransferase family protein [Pseudokineococcus sp. 1T1Z-3]|uniref:acyltransferase family protein n=1 Tax=Pseudokineococcus sp. 1T1Z-3 TaxID=3132745 RepID=UPI0030A68218
MAGPPHRPRPAQPEGDVARPTVAREPQVSEPRDARRRRPHAPPQQQQVRFPGLDGLRGVAALVVVVFHALLLSPVLDDVDAGAGPQQPSWWITHTPLSLLWSGPQAVFVFFVLSGFVLLLPVATGRGIRWRSYFPQRLLRLYVPVWGSIVLALAFAALVPRTPQPGLSGWYNAHAPVQDWQTTLQDAVLVLGTDWLNSPLWSLRYEVLFSLLLPLYVLGAVLLRGLWAPKLVALLVVVGVAEALGMDRLTYLTMFALGAVLALEHERVVDLARRVARVAGHRLGWAPGVLVAVVAVLLLTVEASLFLVGDGVEVLRDELRGVALSLQLLGACLAVLLAAHWAPAVRWLSGRRVQWVALRSFSLYLVHEPVVVSSAALWPGAPVAVHVVVGLVGGLVLSDLFFRAVEHPAHLLSRRVGRAAGRVGVRG